MLGADLADKAIIIWIVTPISWRVKLYFIHCLLDGFSADTTLSFQGILFGWCGSAGNTFDWKGNQGWRIFEDCWFSKVYIKSSVEWFEAHNWLWIVLQPTERLGLLVDSRSRKLEWTKTESYYEIRQYFLWNGADLWGVLLERSSRKPIVSHH